MMGSQEAHVLCNHGWELLTYLEAPHHECQEPPADERHQKDAVWYHLKGVQFNYTWGGAAGNPLSHAALVFAWT